MSILQILLVRADADSGSPLDHDAADAERRIVFYAVGQTLAQAVYLSGLAAPPVLCSGLARCGRCRMRILAGGADKGASPPSPLAAELLVFSPQELAEGWRLACRRFPEHGMRVELPTGTMPAEAPAGLAVKRRRAVQTGESALCLAVDLGTTSLQWRLLEHAAPGRVLAAGSAVNPQMGAGGDVVSRLAVATSPQGKERLQRLTLDALRSLLQAVERPVRAVCLAANPAMTAIALGRDISGLASAPYSLPVNGGNWERLPDLPPVWIPPQLSPFVGGDVSAGYAALALGPALAPEILADVVSKTTPATGTDRKAPAFPFLLADMGTNGEFLLALSPESALAASVALGPALEGVGLSHGSEARPGAVTGFSLAPTGLVAFALPPDGETGNTDVPSLPLPSGSAASGLTGTGAIALLHLLRQCRAMDADGRFTPERAGPLRRFFTPDKDAQGLNALALPGGIAFSAADVEEILKVKAAFSLGLRRLLEAAGLAFRDLTRVYLAGSLGRYVDRRALEDLGFFPAGTADRIDAVGNTALAGAAVLLRSQKTRAALVGWAARAATLDLASDAAFVRDYTERMRFSW